MQLIYALNYVYTAKCEKNTSSDTLKISIGDQMLNLTEEFVRV